MTAEAAKAKIREQNRNQLAMLEGRRKATTFAEELAKRI